MMKHRYGIRHDPVVSPTREDDRTDSFRVSGTEAGTEFSDRDLTKFSREFEVCAPVGYSMYDVILAATRAHRGITGDNFSGGYSVQPVTDDEVYIRRKFPQSGDYMGSITVSRANPGGDDYNVFRLSIGAFGDGEADALKNANEIEVERVILEHLQNL